MKSKVLFVAGTSLLLQLPAHSINANYAKQLERSVCTQVSEAQGCDITKTKAQNARAGLVNEAPTAKETGTNQTPYAGKWIAKAAGGATVATIQIDSKERVKVNAKSVKAKRSDGALVFKDGFITYTIQGDRRLKDEDVWFDSDAGTKGFIVTE